MITERKKLFVELVLPVPVMQFFTYAVPEEMEASISLGIRVAAPFGNRKIHAGIVCDIHHNEPVDFDSKYILDVLDQTAIVDEKQLQFWHWMAHYYMCSMGEVMNAAMPNALRLDSETKLIMNPEYDGNDSALSDQEYLLVDAIKEQKEISLSEVAVILQKKQVLKQVKQLIGMGVVLAYEEAEERYKARMKSYLLLHPKHNVVSAWEALQEFRKSPKQEALLQCFLDSGAQKTPFATFLKEHGFSNTIAKGLIEKEILIKYEEQVNRLEEVDDEDLEPPKALTEVQQKALGEIEFSFESKSSVLLHGVTSSGKTELYIELIRKELEKGRQILYLLPEIALTTQIVNRLRHVFGNRVGVYNSRFNKNEQAEIWTAASGKGMHQYDILLGSRSAVFLPFQNLGLVLIDEEHENSYKQQAPAPRYHGRDAAMYLAALHKAKVLLGTATPSLESRMNAAEGKYGFVQLTERYAGMAMPEIRLIDIKEAHRKKRMHTHFSEALMLAIEETLKEGRQVILFQNRRGYSPRQECQSCGHVPYCPNCDISLTYHKHFNRLVCHYCGFGSKIEKHCGQCGHHDLMMKGFGTEKIEDELKSYFTDAKIERMDLDTTRKKNAYEEIIGRFEDQEIDILVGTQMITKGLDFDHVGVVGVLNADNLLHFPDFRAFERTYQLLTQVAGRAGRFGKQGKVLIQTFSVDHHILRQVKTHDFDKMYKEQLWERKAFKYPPFYRLIQITLKHRDRNIVEQASNFLAHQMRKQFGKRVLGPKVPSVERLRNVYHREILLKFEKELSQIEVKKRMRLLRSQLYGDQQFRSVQVVCDVDPY